MTTENLREFIMLAEMGNYTNAAGPLFISETTLSRHIIALEKELDTPLFRRLPRRVELTEAGTIFMNYAQQIVSEEDAYQLAVTRRLDFTRSTLTIGFDSILAYYDIARLISGFQSKYPEFILQLTESSTFSLREQIAGGQLQLAFILDDKLNRNNSLKYKDYCQDTLVAVFPKGHMLASNTSIHLSMLKREKLLLPPPFTAMYELCAKALRNVGSEPESSIVADFAGKAAPEFIKSGICAAVVPKQIAGTWDNDDIAICEVLPKAGIDTALIYTQDTLSRAGRLFIDYAFGGNRS